MSKNLKEYYSKRNPNKSPEPQGKLVKKPGKKPIFVIQEHAASHLHYDFRLEIDGVLKSWAVPKGPSTDPSVKRLAVPTEDHPLEYAGFEGVIPEGEYGAGVVIIWDTGPYENLKENETMSREYDEGKIEIFLEGHKLKGGYALIRTARGKDERWLFFKMKDEYADTGRNPVETEPESVVSGKKIQDFKR